MAQCFGPSDSIERKSRLLSVKRLHAYVIDDSCYLAGKLSGMGPVTRPPFEALYIYILALGAGYFAADLGVLAIRPQLLNSTPPPVSRAGPPKLAYKDVSHYSGIQDRNMFNADLKIPPPLTAKGGLAPETDGEPVLSQLPLAVQGTMVHANPKKSVATIMIKSRNEAQAFMVDGEIENMAKVVDIERRKVIIRNLNNGRLEFIEIPQESNSNVGFRSQVSAPPGTEVQKAGEFDFAMKRSDISKYTSDLGNILQQARMVPNVIPGSGGRVEGFRFVAIQPGSIYEKLGFKPMDVIKSVNGQDINSPTKAMELYNALKTENRINLSVERNGRQENFNYNITE